MNWIAAYIQAVKINLPSKQRDDVGEELEDLLEVGFERDLGKQTREANESEILEWLQGREHPAVVAARYHDRRNLVSEECFPLFKLTLRIVLIGLAVALGAVAVLRALTTGDYHVPVFDLGKSFLHSGLLAFASVTLIFHFFGDKLTSNECLAKWNPKDLPDPKKSWEQVSWSDSITGFVFTGIFLLLINGYLESVAHSVTGGSFGRVELQFLEPLTNMLPWINSVMVSSILLYGVLIFRSNWSTATLAANIAVSVASLGIVLQLLGYDVYVVALGEESERAYDFDKLIGILNTSIRYGLYFVAGMSVFEIIRGVSRIFQLGGRRLV